MQTICRQKDIIYVICNSFSSQKQAIENCQIENGLFDKYLVYVHQKLGCFYRCNIHPHLCIV